VRPSSTGLSLSGCYFAVVDFEQLERVMGERVERPWPRSPRRFSTSSASDFDRVDRIGGYWGYPATRTFAELLIDCEEDRTLRAVLVGMLREREILEGPLELGDDPGHQGCG
jgi:hypothetical protein